MNFWPFFHSDPNYYLAMDLFAGTGSSRIGDALYGYKRMSKLKIPAILTSKIEIDKYNNIRKKNKFVVSRDGNGKDREKGEEMITLKGHEIKNFVADLLHEYDLKTIFGFCTASGGTSSKLIPWLLTELKEDGFLDNATIFAIMPNISSGYELLSNAMDFLEESALLLDSKKIDSLVLIENDRIERNDSSDYSRTNLAIARCLEIIGGSLLPDSNGRVALDPSDAKKLIFSKSSTLTMSYANLQMGKNQSDSLITNYISDLIKRVVSHNWAGADIENQCKRVYIVLRADPKYLTSNNLDIMQSITKELAPDASIMISDYAVPRSKMIEVAGVFTGIQTDIWKRYKQISPNEHIDKIDDGCSARVALGIEEKEEEKKDEVDI